MWNILQLNTIRMFKVFRSSTQYHFFPFIFGPMFDSALSIRSNPSMHSLYILSTAGFGTLACLPFIQRLAVPTGSAPTALLQKVTTLLSFHLTISVFQLIAAQKLLCPSSSWYQPVLSDTLSINFVESYQLQQTQYPQVL